MFTFRTRPPRPRVPPVRRPGRPRPQLEALEDRLALSWGGIPPRTITPPSDAVAVTLSAQGTGQGNAAVTRNENDFYAFTAPVSGTYRLSALTPNSSLDTVLGVYSAGGSRLAYNDDISSSNRDSRLTVNLTAGTRYFFGITNYVGTPGGSYTWQVDGPSAPDPDPQPGTFDIVIRVSGLSASQQQVFDRAAARWEQIIVGDIPNATYRGTAVDDVLIDASGEAIDGSGGILGQAGPDAFRGGSRLPIHGVMEFDTADLASLESSGRLYDVILHEMGHVLGVGTIWQARGLLSGAGTANPRFLGTRATAEYNALFGATGTSVPVEGNNSPAGSRDSHWRESVFGAELMTPYISGASNPISRVTVASLADLGYTVNMSAADGYAPRGAVIGGGSGGGGGASLVQGPGSSPSLPSLWADTLLGLLGDVARDELSPAVQDDDDLSESAPTDADETTGTCGGGESRFLRSLFGRATRPIGGGAAGLGWLSEVLGRAGGGLEEDAFA